MNKFDRIVIKYRWVFAPIMYVAICVWIFLTAKMTIDGVQLDQVSAGTYALIAWHFMLLLAFACAWLIHKTVDNIMKIRDYFRELKKK